MLSAAPRVLAPVRDGNAPPPYPLTPAFLAALVIYLCRDRAVWGRIGQWIDPQAIPAPGPRLILAAAKAIAADTGRAPEGTAHVLQRIRRWVDDGTHTADDYRGAVAALDTIDEANDRGDLPSSEVLMLELVPELQRRATRDALVQGNLLAAAGRVTELSEVSTALSGAVSIGAATDDLGEGLDDIEAALASIRGRPHCPIGIEEADSVLRGGPHLGSYSLWGAGTGGSKSTSMVHAACTAALLGENALIVATEMETPEYWARVLANLTGYPIDTVRRDPKKAVSVLRSLRRNMGDIRVVALPDGETTVDAVASALRRTEDRYEKEFNFLAIDGIDGVVHPSWKPSDGTNRLGQLVCVQLDRLATGRYGRGGHPLYLHVTSQLQRGKKWTEAAADGTPVPGKDDFADSQYRSRKAHYVFTNTVTRDADTGVVSLYFHVAKSRFSGSGIVFGPLESDLGVARLVKPMAAPSHLAGLAL